MHAWVGSGKQWQKQQVAKRPASAFAAQRTSENMAALLACSQGATMLVNSSSAPYCSAYPFRLPGTPLGERVDAPAATQQHT